MNPVTDDPATASTTTISGPLAIASCAAMALSYVAILYAPTLLLRLPPPTSLDNFMMRRFACAFVSSAASAALTASIVGAGRFRDLASIFGVFGIRADHTWRALVFPLLLTSLVYSGSLALEFWLVISGRRGLKSFGEWVYGMLHNVMAWRNYVVAPFTEELVFRACMIPLLLCGGFNRYNIIFLSPVFFSLAHLNHFLELYCQHKYPFRKALLIVGLQLGYTVIFGWYASFLFIQTGNILSPVVAHIFCNIMGLPVVYSSGTKGLVTAVFVAGTVSFFWLLLPASSPDLYNDSLDNCFCWHGYCRRN
ncbi:CAAX prenyl protease 2 isoform X1 [Asparagus officinalis]|uniref:CAAX prenyl protease 2 isoform X1 n=1 Tax=Asparagus officinalis TaxID=4686 RepID=UPI00098E55CF|nr:CAAX prenyl protease 2 isoform X1 [Asparagus officinalis]